jgi:hypothetical protein
VASQPRTPTAETQVAGLPSRSRPWFSWWCTSRARLMGERLDPHTAEYVGHAVFPSCRSPQPARGLPCLPPRRPFPLRSCAGQTLPDLPPTAGVRRLLPVTVGDRGVVMHKAAWHLGWHVGFERWLRRGVLWGRDLPRGALAVRDRRRGSTAAAETDQHPEQQPRGAREAHESVLHAGYTRCRPLIPAPAIAADIGVAVRGTMTTSVAGGPVDGDASEAASQSAHGAKTVAARLSP